MTNNPRTMSVEEAGQYLGLGRSAAYAAVRRGDIPSVRIGKRFLVIREKVEQLLEAATEPGSA